MKTKNKTLAVVEIAIVLCSVFLVALPAIAADQVKQETITAASASEIYEPYEPGPLDVFGNANEDETIDMRDTTYIKLVIFGKKPKTDFADANYDGKVSMLDVGQTKLIILGKEKKLTYIDIFGEAETVNKPINRLVNLGYFGPQVTRALGAVDILLPVVGGDKSKYPVFWGELSKWPEVGTSPDKCDFEYVLTLNPDAVQTNHEMRPYTAQVVEGKRIFKEKLPGIPLICLNMREIDVIPKSVRTYGYILDRKDEAEELIEWIEGYQNPFKARTEGLSEDERPRVYFESGNKPYHALLPGTRYDRTFVLAGGKNILDEIAHGKTGFMTVDPEWVIEQNPEIIFVRGSSKKVGGSYESDDPSGMAALRQTIFDRPELAMAKVDAVKNGHVYVVDNNLMGGAGNSIIGAAYMGKLFHPGLFKDIDPQAIHQEYIDKFCHINFDVREHGVFMYPPFEEWKP